MGFGPGYSFLRVRSAKSWRVQFVLEDDFGKVLRLENIVESRHAFDTGGAECRTTIADVLQGQLRHSNGKSAALNGHGELL